LNRYVYAGDVSSTLIDPTGFGSTIAGIASLEAGGTTLEGAALVEEVGLAAGASVLATGVLAGGLGIVGLAAVGYGISQLF